MKNEKIIRELLEVTREMIQNDIWCINGDGIKAIKSIREILGDNILDYQLGDMQIDELIENIEIVLEEFSHPNIRKVGHGLYERIEGGNNE